MNMKIGIITILKVNNYGAELQAYATQAVLKIMGYDAEIIDYLFYKNPRHRRTKKSAPVFHFSLVSRLKEWLYPKMTALKTLNNRKTQKIRERRFANFHKENTSLSPTYRSMDELYSARLPYDVYLTGSDQVWNPGLYSSLNPYFLTFAPQGKKRIAYAASFGVSQIPAYAKLYYRERLRQYDAIGVREREAVDMVQSVADRKAEWVLDPTLLLTRKDWMKVARQPETAINGNYILIYELTPCPYIGQLARHFHAAKGWQMVRICKRACHEDKERDIINITDAGPAEFLYLVANAGLVITNSFHGTAFSINFGRDFYTVLPLRKKNNSRQRSLLQMLGLNERLLVEGTAWEDIPNTSIDYSEVDKCLDRERNKSIQFLKDAIDGK